MSKATTSNHNQIIISIQTPHVKMPGVQHLRPEEIKKLVDKEKNDLRAQKVEGRYADIIKYDFIVRKEDIEAGVLGNTPENPKKKNPKRPKTAIPQKNKNLFSATTTNGFLQKTKKTPVKSIKKNANKKPEEENYIENEPENEDINKEQNEIGNDKDEFLNEDVEKNEDNNLKNDEERKEEKNLYEESFEKLENEDEGLDDVSNGEGLDEEIEEENEIGSDKEKSNEDENTMTIDKKNTSVYQSSMANVIFFIFKINLSIYFYSFCKTCIQNWKKVKLVKGSLLQKKRKNKASDALFNLDHIALYFRIDQYVMGLIYMFIYLLRFHFWYIIDL